MKIYFLVVGSENVSNEGHWEMKVHKPWLKTNFSGLRKKPVLNIRFKAGSLLIENAISKALTHW